MINVPYSCILEWKKAYKFINLTINKKKKFRLEGAGQNLSTLNIEDDLMKMDLRTMSIRYRHHNSKNHKQIKRTIT